jgi:hypothetical protein
VNLLRATTARADRGERRFGDQCEVIGTLEERAPLAVVRSFNRVLVA